MDKIDSIMRDIESEWECSGLSGDTLYGNFAKETAKRYAASLEAQLKEREWISVSVDLPKDGAKVAVWVEDIFNPSKSYWTHFWFINGNWHKNAMDRAAFQGGLSVTQWQYISPPKGAG